MLDNFSSINWNDLTAFLAVAREHSLRGAARHLNINHSTVTRRLTALEKALAVKLFSRQPEGYILTQAGEDLLRSAARIEDEILGIHRKIAGQDTEPQGLLRLSIPPAMLRSFLTQELINFMKQYPKIELNIEASHGFSDLTRRETDISIRMADTVYDDVVGRRLARYHKAIYSSPDYLAKVDLACDANGEAPVWLGWGENLPYPKWTRDTPFPGLPVRHQLFSNALQLEAAKAGLGLALLPCFLGDVEEGLVRVPEIPSFADKSIWILFHPDLRHNARVKLFVDYMATVIRKHLPLLHGHNSKNIACSL